MYRFIGAVIYAIIDGYFFLGCMVLLQDKLSKHDNKSEKTNFNNLSVLVIPDILMNIMSCHGFSKYSISTVILAFHISLVTYYIYKVFVIVETEEVGIYNIPISFKNQIDSDGVHTKDILLT